MTQTRLIAALRACEDFLIMRGLLGFIVSYLTLYSGKPYITKSQLIPKNKDEKALIRRWAYSGHDHGCKLITVASQGNCKYHSMLREDATKRIFFITDEKVVSQMTFYTLEEFATFKTVCLSQLCMSQIRRGAVAYTRFDDKSVLGDSPAGYYLCEIVAKVYGKNEEYVITSDDEVYFPFLPVLVACLLHFVEMFPCLCVLVEMVVLFHFMTRILWIVSEGWTKRG